MALPIHHKRIYATLRILFFCMFLMPVIPSRLRVIIIGLLVIVSAYLFFTSKESFKWQAFLISSGFYFVLAASLWYTDDVSYGLRRVETASSIAIFPLVFSLLPIKAIRFMLQSLKQMMQTYVLVVMGLCIALLAAMYINTTGFSILDFSNYLMTINLYLRVESLYLSMHIAIALLFCLFLLRKASKWSSFIFLAVIVGVLLLFLFLLVDKGPIIAFGVVVSFLAFLINDSRAWWAYGITVGVLVGMVVLNTQVNKEFSNLLQITNSNKVVNSQDIRTNIDKCAVDLLPEAGFWGYGVGDGRTALMNCYVENNSLLANYNYNTHNQYLALVLNAGYLCLLLFLFFLIYSMREALKTSNNLAIAVLLFYSIMMFSENILDREDGVIFFAFFIQFLLWYKRRPLLIQRLRLSGNDLVEELSRDR